MLDYKTWDDQVFGFADQRNLGMSMRIERSSLDQVKQRFELNKKKLEEKRKDYDLEQRVKELREEVSSMIERFDVKIKELIHEHFVSKEEKLKAYRREQKREKKRKLDDGSMKNDEEDEMAAIMGFSGFGSSKNSKREKK